jgi:CubicO group peptidase (beta-lactamase class C family)
VTRLLRLFACTVLASVMVTTVAGFDAVAHPSGPDAARLTGYLQAALDSTRLPGVAAAVVDGGRTALVAGLGSDGHGGTVTPRTRFRVASLSKSFTAVAVLQLVEDRRIDLDAPVQAHLPEFAPHEAAVAARVTVRHLLNQTSGLTDAGYPGIVDDGAADLRTRVDLLRTARLVGEPGTRFQYSDLNYQVLGRLVEVLSGVPLARYLDERVFRPLGMTDTVSLTTSADGADLPGLARGHVLLFGCPVARDELDGLLAGSGGVVTTAADMANWLKSQTIGRAPTGERLLSPELLDLTHRPPGGSDTGYGMGWQVTSGPGDDSTRLEHTGVLSTSFAQQVLLPDTGHAFALLYNGNSALADTAGVANGVAALMTGTEVPDVRGTRPVAGLLAVAALAVLAVGARGLLRSPRWADRRRARPWWTTALRLAPLVLPVLLVLGLPRLLRAAIGRSFNLWQLTLAAPDVVILLAVAALTGLAVLAGRAVSLVRAHRAGPARAGARRRPRP